jgi:hypothetical protein
MVSPQVVCPHIAKRHDTLPYTIFECCHRNLNVNHVFRRKTGDCRRANVIDSKRSLSQGASEVCRYLAEFSRPACLVLDDLDHWLVPPFALHAGMPLRDSFLGRILG